MTEREKIAAKIRALMAKTVENGCTEDEAVAAAAMVAKLLARHNMTVDEAELRSSPFKQATQPREDEIGERLVKVAAAIADLTGSRYWRSAIGTNPVEITFFGFTHEVEVSQYLLAICARAMGDSRDQINHTHRLLVQARRRRYLLSFLDGMSDRLTKRIREQMPPVQTGTGLVPLRTALIDQALKDSGMKFDQKRRPGSRSFDNRYQEGVGKADSVSLNRAMSGETAQRKRLR